MSLELKNVEYASELSSQLLKHGEDLEKSYMALQKAIVDKDEKSLQKLLKDLEAKDQWFAKAEAGGVCTVLGSKGAHTQNLQAIVAGENIFET